MPHKKRVLPLTRHCIRSIALNIVNLDECWSSDFHEFGHPDMVSDLVNSLMQELVESRGLKYHHLRVLLHPRIESLDLRRCKIANSYISMRLVAERCSNLTKLDISEFSNVTVFSLLPIVRNLHNIQSLLIGGTRCSDRVLHAIGSNCLDLRELDVNSCPISDNGILDLFNSGEGHFPKCSKLIKLDISGTNVTVQGAQAILLSANNLQQLRFHDTCEAIHGIKEELDKKLLLNKLTNQYCLPEIKPVEFLSAVSDLCPHLTEVRLYSSTDDEGVQCLSSLQNLRVLELDNTLGLDLTFDGIVPVLATRGHQLQVLDLADIDGTDIGLIGMKCPNLCEFSFSCCKIETVEFTHTQQIAEFGLNKVFKFLEKFAIHCYRTQHNLSQLDVRLLLQNSHGLEEFSFAGIQCLDDELCLDMLAVNPFSRLKKASFRSCHEITESLVWKLLSSDRLLLSEVYLTHCALITKQNVEDFKRYAGENNLDLIIQ